MWQVTFNERNYIMVIIQVARPSGSSTLVLDDEIVSMSTFLVKSNITRLYQLVLARVCITL